MYQFTEIGIFDAKMHLSSLVERASKGETIIITRHGHPMAKLESVNPVAKPRISLEEMQKTFADIRAKQEPLPPGVTIKDLINEGRKY